LTPGTFDQDGQRTRAGHCRTDAAPLAAADRRHCYPSQLGTLATRARRDPWPMHNHLLDRALPLP